MNIIEENGLDEIEILEMLNYLLKSKSLRDRVGTELDLNEDYIMSIKNKIKWIVDDFNNAVGGEFIL